MSQAQYVYGTKPSEATTNIHGARTCEDEDQYMLPTLQRMVAEKPTLKLLDIGCGPGSITLGLARYLPEGEVIGADFSEDVLLKAKAAAEASGAQNVTFQKASVYELPFADETFDIVHAHQAIVHFHEHVRAIRELKRVTRKGGVVCMREADLQTYRFFPPDAVLEDSWETLMATFTASGTVSDGGRRLKKWTVEAGFPRESIVFTGGTWCYSTPEQKRAYGAGWPDRFTKGSMAAKSIEIGVCTEERQQEYAKAWRRWLEDDDALFMLMHGQVIARV